MVAVLVTISRRIRVPYPVLLLLGGLMVGLVPGIPPLELDPEIVFLVVLPPLLYVSAFLTPIRDFRSNLKNISLLAVGLVAVSAGVVAAIAMALVPDMTWPLAAALGALAAIADAQGFADLELSPTDPRGFATFGLAGAWLLMAGLRLRVHPGLRSVYSQLAIAGGIDLMALFVATIIGSTPLILVTGGLASVLLGPAFWLMTGRLLTAEAGDANEIAP